ncbi:Cysteine-rich secretory protein family protein [Lutibacter agarilyticus]|uniref:Cysteine-rich secretory protein family protein n=1 Tax=Lutibacter agarilyticus TaxID=1109740 RepID=A0A238VGD3_9FLAO|nr:CAP domain-containing protein [Lutibacter agarilyticus]SNR33450.1 Cysteine-rich secretory protein family protein [Lutibacter agarilyticus]
MKSLKNYLTSCVILCLLFTSCASEDDGIYFDKVANENVEYSKIELDILELVNEYRISKQLNSLEQLNIISSVAETHTTYMAEVGKVSHDNFQLRHQQLVKNAKAKLVGENVGFGYNTAKDIFNAWLDSEPHRLVIEKPNYTHFGISTEQNSEGRNFFTQIFIER